MLEKRDMFLQRSLMSLLMHDSTTVSNFLEKVDHFDGEYAFDGGEAELAAMFVDLGVCEWVVYNPDHPYEEVRFTEAGRENYRKNVALDT